MTLGKDLLSQKPLFDAYVKRSARALSCYHFSSIFAWGEYFEFTIEIINDALCVFAHQANHSFLYLPPLGDQFDLATISVCFERMGKSKLARIENITDNQLLVLKGCAYNEYLKAHEYVYRRLDLADLKTGAYKSKRHDVNCFERQYPQAKFRPFALSDEPQCGDLYRRWADERKSNHQDPVYLHMLEENEGVHARLIHNAQQLGLMGRIVEVDGEIAGYTFGYSLNEETFCVLLEVTDKTKQGSAAYIFNQFCLDPVVQNFEFINTMDDFGMPNVAATKKSYHPCQILPVYNIKLS